MAYLEADMKILHFCAGNQFIENLEYQENVFPRCIKNSVMK